MAAEVRRRMLLHLGLLPDATFDQATIDAVLRLPLTATDRWLIEQQIASAVVEPADAPARQLPTVVVTASPAPTVTVPATSAPAVSVVIVAYGTGTILVDTIASLATAAAASQMPIEVIVVDNPHPGQPDRSLTALRLFTEGVVVVRPSANTGFGGGCELGAIYSRADVLAFVNPDIAVPVGWLEPLVEVLRDRSVSIVAPVLMNADGTVQEVGQTVRPDGWTTPNLDLPDDGTPMAVTYASAACWIIRSAEHERIGGFDPAFHPAYYEDVDLALRARALGGSSVVHPQVQVVHLHSAGTPDARPDVDPQRMLLLTRWPQAES